MKVLIKALNRIIASSIELEQLLKDLTGTYYYEEWWLSKEADDEWEYYLSELEEGEEPEDREEWAYEQEKFYKDHIGYPTFFFADVAQVPDGTWLAHFTDGDPAEIIKQRFSGRDFSVLGLTTNWKEGTNEGPYAFAYKADGTAPT